MSGSHWQTSFQDDYLCCFLGDPVCIFRSFLSRCLDSLQNTIPVSSLEPIYLVPSILGSKWMKRVGSFSIKCVRFLFNLPVFIQYYLLLIVPGVSQSRISVLLSPYNKILINCWPERGDGNKAHFKWTFSQFSSFCLPTPMSFSRSTWCRQFLSLLVVPVQIGLNYVFSIWLRPFPGQSLSCLCFLTYRFLLILLVIWPFPLFFLHFLLLFLLLLLFSSSSF